MAVAFNPAGAWTALVTPFDARGKLNKEIFARFCEFQSAEGITGIVPAGTTGESPTLTWEEHNEVVEIAVQVAGEKIGVLAGTGSNCTDEAVAATKHARECGASAALLVDCYYNGPSSLELRTEYYEKIIRWVPDLPLVPYIIPGRTGAALSSEDLAILHLTFPKRVPAVKQATGDLERMRKERELCGAGFAIMSGDDDLTLPMMKDAKLGASGVISVMTNVVPGAIAKMVAAQRAGDGATAERISQQLQPIFSLVTFKLPGERVLPGGKTLTVEDRFRNPTPVKTMLAGLGVPVGPCRAPLGKMPKAAVERCRAALQEVFRADPSHLTPLNKHFGVNVEKQLADDAAWAAVTRA